MTDNALEIIKDELARIDEARAKALKGQYEYDDGRGIRENACGWLEYESFAANEITKLTKALSVAVERIESFQQPCTRTDYTVGQLDNVVCGMADEALTTIANILTNERESGKAVSGGKDGI